MIVCKRLVALAGPVQDPLDVNTPQVELVQGRVGVNIEPSAIQNGPAPLATVPDLWDVLVDPEFDAGSHVILHEAELQDDGTIVVKRDLFGPGDYGHNWAGWPIPGDPVLTPQGEPTPPTVVLSSAERKALAYLRRRRAA